MKQVLLFLSAAAMLLIGWRVISGLAQDEPQLAAPPGAVEAQAQAGAAPAEITPEQFEIDRSPQFPPADPAAAAAAHFEKNGWHQVWPREEKPQRTFWGRLFGAGKDKAKDQPPVAGAPPVAPAAPVAGMPVVQAAPVAGSAPTAAAAVPYVPPPIAAQVEEPKQDTPEASLAMQEEARRQAAEIEGLKNLDLAYQAMSRTDFDEAIKLFDKALSIMPMRPYTVDTRSKARAAWAQCESRLALNSYQRENLEEARRHVTLALGMDAHNKDAQRLQPRIEQELVAKPTPVSGGAPPAASAGTARTARTARPPPLWNSPEIVARQKRIKDAMLRGQQYMQAHEYDKAVNEFKIVLLEDEGNEDANANLKKIAETGYKLESQQFNRMKAEMMTQVRDTWTPPVKKDFSQPVTTADAFGVIHPDKQRLLKKLETIVIPQLDFREANIVDVIRYLDQQTIIADKTSPAGEKGVNIMLNLARPGQAGPAAAPAPESAPAGEDIFGADSQPGAIGATPELSGIHAVTMTLRNVVLLDALKFITEVTGLKYRIESNVVMITPADVVWGEVLTKTYRVQPNLGDLIRGSLGAGAAGAAGAAGVIGTDLIATPMAAIAPGNDVKKFFVDTGVPFPEGTSIKYQQSLNLLIVANTAENLEKFEQILLHLNVIPMQVEIEARFVEIAQTDLEELGIEWLLTDNWEIAQDASAAAVPLSARERVQVNKNALTKGLRNFSDLSGNTGAGGTLGGILSVSSILTNPELSFILHALEQRSGANLLSAPKVTTKSGANAEIKVVREIIYPTEWSQGGGAVGQAVATAVIITPTSFETRDTGVILNVTPVVGPDGYTIDLAMMPQVVELSDWINYGSTIVDAATGQPITMNNPQPIFHSRSIATSISIWDGQTVVMGGLITENESTTEDKVPFLGDIPLIGFFFKSKTTKSVKRNLLIFVTANLVDPAGNKINKAAVDLTAPTAIGVTTTP